MSSRSPHPAVIPRGDIGATVLVIFTVLLALAACTGGDRDGSDVSTLGAQPLDGRLIELGEGVYAADCASSHGATGEGTPSWHIRDRSGALPPPPNDSTGHTWHHLGTAFGPKELRVCRLAA